MTGLGNQFLHVALFEAAFQRLLAAIGLQALPLLIFEVAIDEVAIDGLDELLAHRPALGARGLLQINLEPFR